MKKYDVIVLGGGAGGLTVSMGLAQAGKKVLLIEKRKLGGECTWAGCIPSKAFIKRSEKETDSEKVFQEVREVIKRVYSHETPQVLTKLGIEVIFGEGKFVNKNEIQVDGNENYWGKNIVISTGSSPGVPGTEGLEAIDYLTNENFFLQKKAPQSILFIGGGVISLEMAFPLKRMGASVTILEKNKDLLSLEEPEVRERIMASLKEKGIQLILGADIQKFKKSENFDEAHLADGRIFRGEKIFISAGRVPNISNLDLDKAGVLFDKKGIIVNEYLSAGNGIFAIGDCVGPYRFSHIAGLHGEIVIQNILLPFFKKKIKYTGVPWTTFTSPEYSRTGTTEEEALKKYGSSLKVYTLTSENDRSLAVGEDYFILKVICLKGKILGATCVGDRAGEVLGIIQTLMSLKIPFYKYRNTLQSYPTYCDMIRKIGKTAYIDYLKETFPYKLFFH